MFNTSVTNGTELTWSVVLFIDLNDSLTEGHSVKEKREEDTFSWIKSCQIKSRISFYLRYVLFFHQSQAEAHYKGNRHARRVKGIETSKTSRFQDGDKQHPPPASPSPPGMSPSSPEPDPNKQGEHHLWHMKLHTNTHAHTHSNLSLNGTDAQMHSCCVK